MMAESWASEGICGHDRGRGVRRASSRRDGRGRVRTVGDAAGKAVNRKVHGSNPCSGASSELESAPGRYSKP